MKKKLIVRAVILSLLFQAFLPLWTGISYGLYNRPVLNVGDQIRISYGSDDETYSFTTNNVTLKSGNILKLVATAPQINDFVLYERDYKRNDGWGEYWTTDREIKVFNPHVNVNTTEEYAKGWVLVGKVEKVAEGGNTYKDSVNLSRVRYDVVKINGRGVGPFPVNTYAQIVDTDYKVGDYIVERYTYGSNKTNFVRQYDGVSYPARTILGKLAPFNDYIYSYVSYYSIYYYCLNSMPLEPNTYKFTRSVPIPTSLNSDYRIKGTPLTDNRVAFMNNGGAFYIFDPLTDSWEEKSSYPSHLINSQYAMWTGPDLTTLPNNKIVAGGSGGYFGTSYSERQSRDIFIYNVATDTWETRIANALDYYPADKALAAIDNNTIVAIGGEDWTDNNWWSYNIYSHLIKLSPYSSTQATGNLPGSQGRGYSMMRAFKLPNGKFLALGGTNRGYGSLNTQIFEYDSVGNTIAPIHNLFNSLGSLNSNSAGQYYTSQIGADKFLIKGQESSITFLYDYATNSVGMIPILHEPWYGAVTARVQQAQRTPNGTVVFMGGDGYVWKAVPNRAPTINITQPTSGQEVQKGKILNIRWTKGDLDNDSLTDKIRIYTDTQEIYYGSPNVAGTATSGQHNLNTSNIPVAWNAVKNRYEKKIYIEVTTTDGIDGAISTRDALVVNYNAIAVVSTPATTHVVNYQDAFSLGLKVWHAGTGRVDISATINGKTKTAVLDPTPGSMPAADNVTLTWSGTSALNAGTYKDTDISIRAMNTEGVSIPVTWNGTIIVMDILTMINEGIGKAPINTNKDDRFVLVNTESPIQNTTRNTGLLQSIKNRLNGREQNALWIGKGDSKAYVDNQLKINEPYLYKATPADAKGSIIDFILGIISGNVGGEVFCVGDDIDTLMLFEDYEKDYGGIGLTDKLKSNLQLENEQKIPKAGTLQIQYTHNPSVFDNPVTKHNKGDEVWYSIADMKDPFVIQKALFDMRGEWTMTLQASDETKNPEFDKYAAPRTKSFLIHTAPTAIAKIFESPTHIYLSAEDSFDTDYQYTLPNNGITNYEWQLELSDGTIIKHPSNGKYISTTKQIDGKMVTSFTLTVTDWHGATGTTNVAGLITPELRAKLLPELSKFSLLTPGIPASEQIKIIDIETIPYPMNRIEFALEKDGVRRTPLRTLNNPADLELSTPPYNKWRDIRNYTIPETLPDDTYTARVRAIQGTELLEKLFTVRVSTPINLQPSMPALVRTDETYDITAETTKYANRVEVTAFKGTPYQSSIISLDGSITGDLTNWIKPYKIPSTIPEGIYTFEFRATTPNGNQEIKTVEVYVEALKVEASLKPNPALAGDEIIFTVKTKGYVDRIEIDVDPDIIAKDDRVGKYTYPTLKFNVNGAIDEKTDTLKYILPLKTDQTISKDDIRLRDEYTFIARGYRGTNNKEVELKLDVRRSLLDLLRPGIKTN